MPVDIHTLRVFLPSCVQLKMGFGHTVYRKILSKIGQEFIAKHDTCQT